jgi:predicted RNase H-like nuclease (RuvC/YqgF family)
MLSIHTIKEDTKDVNKLLGDIQSLQKENEKLKSMIDSQSNYIESLENYLYEANSELNELKWQRDKNICYKIKKWFKLR